MATWDFISKRRRIRLAKFVEGATTLEQALDIFRRKGVTPPDDGALEKLFAPELQPDDVVKVEAEAVEPASKTLDSNSKESFTTKPKKQTASSKKSGNKKKKQTLPKETSTDDELGSGDDL